MSVIRPAARAALWRWRELGAAGALAAIGLWAVVAGLGIVFWLGWVLIAAAAALGLAGVQRARFRSGGGGPGVVAVDEGLIAYFGPHTGGAVALSEMTAVAIEPGPPRRWRLSQPGQPDLAIPLDATGADALFDAFAALPGLRTGTLLAAMRDGTGGARVLWTRDNAAVPERARLH